MTKEELHNIVVEIASNHTEYKTTPRELMSAFNAHRRTSGNVGRMDAYLKEHNVCAVPSYHTGWMNKEIVLKEIQAREPEEEKSSATERYMPTWNELKMKGLVVVKMGIPVVQNDLVQSIIDYLSEIGVIRDENGISINKDELGISEPAYAQLCSDLNLMPWKKHEVPSLHSKVNAFINGLAKKVKKDSKSNNSSNDENHLLSCFQIKHYKNIEDLTLEGLKRINLLVGANSAGKSNLLEAISLYTNNWSLGSLLQILGNRKEKTDDFTQTSLNKSIDNLLGNFAPILPYRDANFLMNKENNAIVLGSGKHFVQLALMNAYYRRDDDTEANRLYQLSPYAKRITKISSNSEVVLAVTKQNDDNDTASIIKQGVSTKTINIFQFTKNGLDYTNYSKRENTRHCILINCKSLSTELAQQLWTALSLTDKEDEILSALQMIDGQIEGFNFIHIEGRIVPIVKVKRTINGSDRFFRMPISEFGDGMVHVLNIIIALLSCQNGTILLDEVESGLHYTTQRKLWKMIYALAEKYDVQVFATTHSNDCIESFAKSGITNLSGIMIRLSSKSGVVAPVYYNDVKEIIFGLQYNIEGR